MIRLKNIIYRKMEFKKKAQVRALNILRGPRANLSTIKKTFLTHKYLRCSSYLTCSMILIDLKSGRGRAVKALVLGTSSKERAFNSRRPHKNFIFGS